MKTGVAVLISGRGSNMLALAEAANHPAHPAAIVGVIADSPGAPGVVAAAELGIPTATVERERYPDRAAFEGALDAAIARTGAGVVCLAGFMRILSPDFVERRAGMILNIHPSLLPAFRGLDTHRRALAAGVKIAGCTVHIVTASLDDGQILGQAAVPVLPDDDEAALAARILVAEHALYPVALANHITGAPPAVTAADAALFNPDAMTR